ncbi:hypothetical protein [Paenibacillus vini]|uniref:Apea-like HEPN domain-containing protein n=1 Tax=Paenibacillus vini TaxID=1476024 RepID=A0ABQ4M9A1_9BACL|nr:hypothetical protein [Paenibacillus vini]GIP52566.1 hypothetical protein J42TS3_16010 [Paenibacillus vini]
MNHHHTHFVLKFPQMYGIETLKEVLNSEELININHQFNIVGDLIFFSIYDIDNNSRKYEKSKKVVIRTIGIIEGTYLSVLYDSQTAEYLESISSSIYELERNFRNLIEIKMLREVGPMWKNQYLSTGENTFDRRTGRKDDIFKYLANPLDDYNFKNLSSFVKENIRKNRNDILEKLEIIDKKLDNIKKIRNGGELLEVTEDIVGELNHLKVSLSNTNDLFSEDIYTHIKPDLVEEWNRVYDYRNFWAHNIFLMTETEYSEYHRLSQRINKKITVELTIDTLLDSLNFKEYDGVVRLTISKYENEVVQCEIKIKFCCLGKYFYVSKLESDYLDIYYFFCVLFKKQQSFIEKINSTYFKNPYLSNIFFTQNELFTEWLEQITEEEIQEIVKSLTEEYKFSVKTANQPSEGLVTVNEDHHKFLKKIFS